MNEVNDPEQGRLNFEDESKPPGASTPTDKKGGVIKIPPDYKSDTLGDVHRALDATKNGPKPDRFRPPRPTR